MAKIALRMDYLEQHLFDGKAHIDKVVGINTKDRLIDLEISGVNVPNVERVVEVVTERGSHLLPAVWRDLRFEPENPLFPQMDLAIASTEPTVTIPASRMEAFKRGLMAVEQMMACSSGVVGISPLAVTTDWRDLRPEGQHDGWLKEFWRALDLIEQE